MNFTHRTLLSPSPGDITVLDNSATGPTSSRYVDLLAGEAVRHRAVRHPWLTAFATGRLTDMKAAIRDYARQYQGYSAWFPRYVQAAISRLDRDDHRRLLRHNLEEEHGRLDADDMAELAQVGIPPESVAGVPHPELFRRFCRAVDAEPNGQPGEATQRWRGEFLTYLQGASPAAAVGALGLGTETIVKPIYRRIVEGLEKFTDLSRPDYVFFELHYLVDEQHQLDLLQIGEDLAATPSGRRELRNGMLKALELRCAFWDHLLECNRQRTRVA